MEIKGGNCIIAVNTCQEGQEEEVGLMEKSEPNTIVMDTEEAEVAAEGWEMAEPRSHRRLVTKEIMV